jgi:exodeoxyribonuclease V alpha subunit
MLARNLVYTGVTRGKRLVVIVGQKKALGIAVRGGAMKPRWTKLREWLNRENCRQPSTAWYQHRVLTM